MSEQRFTLRARIASFGFAFRGIARMFQTQHNAMIHFVAAILAVILGWVFEIGRLEWLAIVLAIAGVLSAEAMNSAIEALADVVSPERHPGIERAKDVAAGAVLLAAMGAAVVGILVFGPGLLALFSR